MTSPISIPPRMALSMLALGLLALTASCARIDEKINQLGRRFSMAILPVYSS